MITEYIKKVSSSRRFSPKELINERRFFFFFLLRKNELNHFQHPSGEKEKKNAKERKQKLMLNGKNRETSAITKERYNAIADNKSSSNNEI